jgi:hypothetical protein
LCQECATKPAEALAGFGSEPALEEAAPLTVLVGIIVVVLAPPIWR